MSEAKKTKKAAPVEAEVVNEEPKAVSPKKKVMVGTIFWGFALILFGALLLLDNLGVVKINFSNLWQLWPVAVIGAGISMLSLRGWLAGLVAIVTTVVLAGLVYLVAVENPYYTGFWDREGSSQRVMTHEVELDSAADKGLNVEVDTGAIGLTLASSSSVKGLSARLESERFELQEKSSEVRDGVQYVALETDTIRGNWFTTTGNNLRLELSEQTPLALKVDAGASSVKGDVSQVPLKQLEIDTGASSIDLKLGDKLNRQEVIIDAGASSVKLSLPKNVGVRVESEVGLTSTNFEDVAKVSNNLYESADFGSAEKQIVVRAKLGVSSFHISRY